MGRRAVPVLLLLLSFVLLSAGAKKEEKDVTELQIGVKFKPKTCHVQAHKGDQVKVHYRGSLTDGSVFDESYARGDPIDFELGSGQVIKGADEFSGKSWQLVTAIHDEGWDQGLLGMCVGEKRKLKIPSTLGYGAQGSPPKIPGGATLIFETELVAVNGNTGQTGTVDSEL